MATATADVNLELISGPPYRTILRLAMPTVIAMLSQSLVNEIDVVFFSHLPHPEDSNAQAALLPSLLLVWLFGGSLSAISVGTQALTARRYGEGDVSGAGKVMVNSAVLAFVTATAATIAAILLVPVLFPLMHSDPNVQRIGISFCQIRFLGILPMVLTASLKSFYDGIGRTHVHMAVAITMNVVNLLLCWLLVFGKAGAPALGVNGAGWAAVVSGGVGALMMIVYSLRGADRARFQAFHWKNLDGAVTRSIATLSVFSGFATVVVMTGFALFLRIPAYLDTQQGAGGANTAAAWDVITIMMVVFMTCIAFGTSTATLVSQSLGAKKPDLAARYGWQSVYFMVAVMTLLGACIFAFPEELIRLFLPKEEGKVEHLKDAVVSIAIPSLRFSGVIAPIAAAALVLTQALYGAGESRFVAIAEFTLHFLCFVPLAFIFSVVMGMGLIGCWYATAIYGLLLLSATAWRFWSGQWKRTIL